MTMVVNIKMDLLWIQTKCRKFDNWEENKSTLIQGTVSTTRTCNEFRIQNKSAGSSVTE